MEELQFAVTQHIQELRSMTTEDLDKHIESGEILVCDNYTSNRVFEDMPLEGGWILRSSKPAIWNLPTVLFIAPSDHRTSVIWRRSQRNRALDHGLNRVQAGKWLNSRYPHRHLTLPLLGKLLDDISLLHLYLSFSGVKDKASSSEWERRNKIDDGLFFKRRQQFVAHVREVLGKRDANLLHYDMLVENARHVDNVRCV
jgi:hypothetical protein